MKLGEKIRLLRKEKGLSLVKLEKKLVEIFGRKALRYNTLYRIEKGLRDARVSSLSQICTALGVSLKELKKGTEEERLDFIHYFKKQDKVSQYVYSEKANLQILTTEKQPFLGLRLILEPGGKTRVEQDPNEPGGFQKWVYGLKGNITVFIGKDKYVIHKDDALCFESNLPHYFENRTSKKASCIIIQSPKHF